MSSHLIDNLRAEFLQAKQDEIHSAILSAAKSGMGFTPRWLARTRGFDLNNVITACERMEKVGIIERYERPLDRAGHATETYFRVSKIQDDDEPSHNTPHNDP